MFFAKKSRMNVDWVVTDTATYHGSATSANATPPEISRRSANRRHWPFHRKKSPMIMAGNKTPTGPFASTARPAAMPVGTNHARPPSAAPRQKA